MQTLKKWKWYSGGYDNIFRGIIKCADCGSAIPAKAEQKRKRRNVTDRTFCCCIQYRKFGKDGCSSHSIEAGTVLNNIYVSEHSAGWIDNAVHIGHNKETHAALPVFLYLRRSC